MNSGRIILLVTLSLLIFAIIGSAANINIGGGTAICTSEEGRTAGEFTIDDTGAYSTLSSTNAITLKSHHWAEDRSGKRAEVSLDVKDGTIIVSKATLLPKEGKAFLSWPSVLAQQNLVIVNAKRIETGSMALNPAGQLLAETSLLIEDDTQKASLSGINRAFATEISQSSAQASQQGQARGKTIKESSHTDVSILPSTEIGVALTFASTSNFDFRINAAAYAKPPKGFESPDPSITVLPNNPLSTAFGIIKSQDLASLASSNVRASGHKWAYAEGVTSLIEPSYSKASAQAQ
jgi:hypothetical protein